MSAISRRQWAGVTMSALAVPGLLRAGTRVLSREPLITAQDFAQYPAVITPTEDFFVRNHFSVPEIDASHWEMRVEGLVGSPAVFGLAKLRKANLAEITSVVECAGNGSGMGGVGCVWWRGVRLADILASCNIDPRARWVRMTGMDRGSEPDSNGEISYSRTISLERAKSPATLVALEMNGAPLTLAHGAPCRVLVAGHYGMDSVKWLQRIELIDQPDDNLFMARRFRRVLGESVGAPVSLMRVKSLVVTPAAEAVLRGVICEAGGYAWSGTGRISRVEVQLDAQPWRSVRLLQTPGGLAWVPWAARLESVRPGVHCIAVRAFTDAGEQQPVVRDPSRQDAYELNAYARVRFLIRP